MLEGQQAATTFESQLPSNGESSAQLVDSARGSPGVCVWLHAALHCIVALILLSLAHTYTIQPGSLQKPSSICIALSIT